MGGYGLDDRDSILSIGRQVIFLSSSPRPDRLTLITHLHAKVNDAWKYTSTPQYVLMTRCSVKQRIGLHGVVLS